MSPRIGVLGLLWVGLSGCLAASLETRDVIADLSYPKDAPSLPPSQLEFQLYAALQLNVGGPWRDPRTVARCFDVVTGDALRTLGEATAGAHDTRDWAYRTAAALDAALRPVRACSEALMGPDGVQLAWALGKAGDVVQGFVSLTWLAPQHRDETWAMAASALRRHARVIAKTPPAVTAQGDLPVLALSGGAANGAFTAGFLYELLATREAALAMLPEGEREAADVASRFSAVVGTSVGAVQSELLDFLWAEEGPLTPPQQRFIDACTAATWEPPRAPVRSGVGCFAGGPAVPFPTLPMPSSPRRACALTLLLKYFADSDETKLLCAEAGSVARAVGFLGAPTLNLMRFDELQKSPMTPLLDAFGPAMKENGLNRVTVAVEAQQSQLLGLDERACPEGERSWCLSSGVMASAVMPGFARPVTHAWSGFSETGECGVWFDGGMRSGLPVLRALSLSRAAPVMDTPRRPGLLRVLGLDTGRLTSSPAAAPSTLVDVAMGALEQLYTQNGTSELLLAQQQAELRDAELAVLSALLRPVSQVARRGGDQVLADDPRVRGLFVPSDVPDWVVVGAGYAFDPPVMRGLFIWGREVARTQLLSAELGQKLGWPVADAMQRLEETRRDDAYTAWLDAYRSESVCPAWEAWRVKTGAARVRASMARCEDDPRKMPPYFSCPADAWKLGGAR